MLLCGSFLTRVPFQREMLKRIDVPLEKLKFVKGTSYQKSPEYTMDMYRMAAMVTTAHTKHAGAEVVKQSENPKMSNLLYPILQALDEEYLKVDVQFGGLDQRKIFMFAREWLPKLGYSKRAYIMNDLIPGLGKSGKMSSSEPGSKIDFHDSEDSIQEKMKGAFSVDGKVKDNGLLAIMKHILFRYLEHVGRAFECGGKSYGSYEALEKDFAEGTISSALLKPALAQLMCEFLKPLREFWASHQELYTQAYPPELPQVRAVAWLLCLWLIAGVRASVSLWLRAQSPPWWLPTRRRRW